MTALYRPIFGDAHKDVKHINIMPDKIHEFLGAHGVSAISVFEIIDFCNHGNESTFKSDGRVYEIILVVGLGPRYYLVTSFTA